MTHGVGGAVQQDLFGIVDKAVDASVLGRGCNGFQEKVAVEPGQGKRLQLLPPRNKENQHAGGDSPAEFANDIKHFEGAPGV